MATLAPHPARISSARRTTSHCKIKVNGGRALRLEPTTNDADHAGIVNGGRLGCECCRRGSLWRDHRRGSASNYFGLSYTNRVDAHFGSIGGGRINTIQHDAFDSTIGGGVVNSIKLGSSYSTISGGDGNLDSD